MMCYAPWLLFLPAMKWYTFISIVDPVVVFVTYPIPDVNCCLYNPMPFGVVCCSVTELITMEEEQAQPEWVVEERKTIRRFLARDKLLSNSVMLHCFVTFRKGPYYRGRHRTGDGSNTVDSWLVANVKRREPRHT